MAATPTVVINGADLRAHFGVEVLGVTGPFGVGLTRRVFDAPLRHGAITQGGTLKPGVIRLTGYIKGSDAADVAIKKAAFLRHIQSDQSVPAAAYQGGRIQLADRSDAVFLYDTMELLEYTGQTNQWFTSPEWNFSVEFWIEAALPRRIRPHRSGMSLETVPDFVAAGSAPEFAILSGQADRLALSYRRLSLALGGPTAASPGISSSELGATFDFNGSLVGKGTEGSDVTAVLHGYQAANLLADGDMEAATTAAWSTSSATLTKTPTMQARRVLTGTQAMKVVITGAGGKVYQTPTLTVNKEYRVSFLIQTNTALSQISFQAGAFFSQTLANLGATTSQICLVEFTFKATSGGAQEIRLVGSAGTETFIIDDFVVAPSSLANGTFGSAFGPGAPTNWTAGGTPTIAADGTNYWGAANSLDITLGTGDSLTADNVALTAGKIYHVSGRIRGISNPNGGSLVIKDVTNHPLYVTVKPTASAWTRFSFHFRADASANLQLRLTSTAASLRINLDSLAVCELAAKGSTDPYFFDPGPYGRALQMRVGECLDIPDYVNRSHHTIVAQIVPYFGQGTNDPGWGTCAILSFGYDAADADCLFWDQGEGAAVWVGRSGAARIVSSYVGGVTPFYGSANRGVMGFVARFTNGGWLASSENGRRLMVEEPDANGVAFDQDSGDTSSSTTRMSATPDHILLSDAGQWAGFWIYQYPRETTKCFRDLVALEPPPNLSRKMTYSGTLAAGEVLHVNLEDFTVELWDSDAATKLANAFGLVSGDLPRWYECPVLFTRVNLGSLRTIIHGEG